ncbi:MAG: hypothetical protein A2Y97_13780 [Nitrospirae bacterium RBG_13_39_12]|nr:MAG: hypothetical protein A2Y97_13780 [Nitrospirae bacterium RBG_13_39_12]
MFCYLDKLDEKDIGGGIRLKAIGSGENMNVLHWDMADKSTVPMHQHPEEQFGYVIKGGFQMIIGDQTAILKAGDSYFIPPNVPHEFTAIGDTEAIDVFSPVRTDFPWKKAQ